MQLVKKATFVMFLVAVLLCGCLSPQMLVAQKTIATIKGFSMPFKVVVDPSGTYAYVTNGGTGSVWVIDTATNKVVSKITKGNDPFGMDFTPDGKYLYITNGGSDTVWVVDVSTNVVVEKISVGNGPHGLAINPKGDFAYVTNFGSHTVSVVSIAYNKVVGTITVGNNPQGVVFTSDGKYAYVTCFGLGTISVIDTATSSAITSIYVESGPIDVTLTPDGKYVYVSNSGSETISIISTETNTVVRKLEGFMEPFDIVITADGTTAYVANGSVDWVSVLDIATGEIKGKITVGKGPYGMALTPDEKFLYVVDFYGPTVSVVDLGKKGGGNVNSTLPDAPWSIVKCFSIPVFGSRVNFAVNNTYTGAELEDNKWVFTDLCVAGSVPMERFEVSTQNADMTIFSCTTVRTTEIQSVRLDCIVEGKGQQVLSFGSLYGWGGRVEWRVTCNGASLTEDVDWSVSDDKETITINGVEGDVSVARYYFSSSFDKPELTFIERHLVAIVIGAIFVTTLSIAVFVRVKTKESENGGCK